MNETSMSGPLEHINLPSDVQAEYLAERQLDVDTERQRSIDWRKTGECPGPTVIGQITLTEDQIATLAAELQHDFTSVTAIMLKTPEELTDEDKDSLLMSSKEDAIGPLSEESRAIIKSTYNAFSDLIQRHIEADPAAPMVASMLKTTVLAGVFDSSESGDTHTDAFGSFGIRYGVTLAGPTTKWIVGTVDPEDFDEEDGDYVGDGMPYDLRSSKVGSLVQFATDCDPHEVPGADPPEFRFTMFATIYPEEMPVAA